MFAPLHESTITSIFTGRQYPNIQYLLIINKYLGQDWAALKKKADSREKCKSSFLYADHSKGESQRVAHIMQSTQRRSQSRSRAARIMTEARIVRTRQGRLRGVLEHSSEGYDYLAFKGIPLCSAARWRAPIPGEFPRGIIYNSGSIAIGVTESAMIREWERCGVFLFEERTYAVLSRGPLIPPRRNARVFQKCDCRWFGFE